MNSPTARLALLYLVNYTNLGLVFTKPICSIMPFVLFSFSLQNGLFTVIAHTTTSRRRHYISGSTASCIQSPLRLTFSKTGSQYNSVNFRVQLIFSYHNSLRLNLKPLNSFFRDYLTLLSRFSVDCDELIWFLFIWDKSYKVSSNKCVSQSILLMVNMTWKMVVVTLFNNI